MDFGRKIICPMDGYTEKTVYMVELTDDNGKKTGYLSNGCDDANGGEVCERCRGMWPRNFPRILKVEFARVVPYGFQIITEHSESVLVELVVYRQLLLKCWKAVLHFSAA